MSKNASGKTCPRKVLPLKERIEAVQLSRQGKSARQIALELGVGRTQVQNILKNKEEILRVYEGGVPSGQKRRRKTGNEEVNSWYVLHNRRAQVRFGNARLRGCGSFIKRPPAISGHYLCAP